MKCKGLVEVVMRNENHTNSHVEGMNGVSPGDHKGSHRRKGNSREQEMTILHLLKNRDPDVLNLLKREYQAKLSSVAYSICRNHEDVEEVLQDVYLTAIEKIDTFQQRSSLQTWLYRITMNAALMKQRGQRRSRMNVPLETLGPSFGEQEDFFHVFGQVRNPEEVLFAKELSKKLSDWVQELPIGFQNVIRRRVEGYSVKETSDLLNTTEAAVKSRMHRTRNSLREEFRHYFSEN